MVLGLVDYDTENFHLCGECGCLVPKEEHDPNAWHYHSNLHELADMVPVNGKVITLCGSTRFYKEFDDVSLDLTLNGYLVFSLGTHRRDDKQIIEVTDKKELLNKTHRQKIKLSDSIFVVDVDGYIGEHIKSEIEYAKELKKNIYYYSKGDLVNLI